MPATARKLAVALVAGLVLAWAVGSSGAQTPGGTTTAVTKTVREPARTVTVTDTVTRTVTQPAQTVTNTQNSRTTVIKQTTVPSTTTTGGDSSKDLPWWGWLLIALGGIAIGVAAYSYGRRHEDRAQEDGTSTSRQ